MKNIKQTVKQRKQTKQVKSAPKRTDKPCKKANASKKTPVKQTVAKSKTAATKASAASKKTVAATKPKQVQKPAVTKTPPKATPKRSSAPKKREIKVGDKIVGEVKGAVGIVRAVCADTGPFGAPQDYAVIEWQYGKNGEKVQSGVSIGHLQKQASRGDIKITTPRKSNTAAEGKKTPAKTKKTAANATKPTGQSSSVKQKSVSKAVSTKPTSVSTVAITIKSLPDKKGGHIHFILDNVDDKHVSVGVTHDKYKGKNHPNIPLDVNPTGGAEPSYMKRQGTVAKQKRYSDEQQGKISEKDLTKAVHIGEKAKQKYVDKKK